MDKAFDSKLCTEIDAKMLAKNKVQSKYFRYKCLCCGEEVCLAAADSATKAPHFRHRRGNNNKECERYLGQPGVVEKLIFERKRNKEQVYFFFNNEMKTIEIGIAFRFDELENLKTKQALLELKTEYNGRAFPPVPVSDASFFPDEIKYFTIKEYSPNYFLSIADKVHPFYNIIAKKGKITFFKSRIQDERAKKVSSERLYTGTKYIAISEEELSITKLVSNVNVESAKGLFMFTTMGKTFFRTEFVIRSDDNFKLMLHEQNLQVETAQTFNVLWPPIFSSDNEYICESDKIYVNSSFQLIQHDNTNAFCNTDDLPKGITQITLEERTVIFEKNIELTLLKVEADQCELPQYDIEKIYSSKWKVTKDMDYYIFNRDGCRKLSDEENVYLTEKDTIKGYKHGRIQKVILSNKKIPMTTQEIIEDILKYHPQTEIYNSDFFTYLHASGRVISYLDECYKSGSINTVVKKYIEEGLL